MISPARRLCYSILLGIETRGLFSDDALHCKEMERLDLRDRHLTTEIVYGTLRWQGLLDHVLSDASARPWEDVAAGAKILLRMSFYQMWRMDRIPQHALVHDAVEIAKHKLGRGVSGYINGVLRNLVRSRSHESRRIIEKAPDWIQVSFPQWLWQRYASRYGSAAAREYALALNLQPCAALRLINMKDKGRRPDSDVVPSDLVPNAFIEQRSHGRKSQDAEDSVGFRFQDEASQLIPHLLGSPSPKQKIWDACAAPGGKSSILCALYGNSGQVISSDIHFERTRRLSSLLKNEGFSKSAILLADARQSPPFRGGFDAVLADVPCSGLGTLRRNPEIKWSFNPDRFMLLNRTQKQILESVAQAVRPGGHLLYSTCSTEPEENEDVIAFFLENHPEFNLERPTHPPGIDAWISDDHMVRTFPGTRLWDGFFAALMVRHRDG
jgi:16S rRNA (cytosine967-C5)-methyltransferase